MSKRYLEIAEELRKRIEAGHYELGGRIEAERDLVRLFDASRTTVRKALDLLEADNLVHRKQGRGGGTFVRSRPPEVELTSMRGFMPQLRERGMSVNSHLLSATLEYANAEQAEQLGVSLRSALFRVDRLRSVDGVPLLLEESYFPAVEFPDLLEADLTQSLYELLERRYGRSPVTKHEVVIPSFATSKERARLKIGKSVLVLRIKRTAYDAAGQPIEYSVDVLRSDVARVRVSSGELPPDTEAPAPSSAS